MPNYQYSSTPLYVAEGQTVQFRYEAPANFAAVEQVIIQIGELTTFWVIETVPEDTAPDAFGFQQIDDSPLHDPPNNPVVYTYAETAAGPDAAPFGGGGLGTPLRNGEEVITITGLSDTTQVSLLLNTNALDKSTWAYRIRTWNGTSYNPWPAFTTGDNYNVINPPQVGNQDQFQIRTSPSTFPASQHIFSVGVGQGQSDWVINTGSAAVNTPNPAPIFNPLNNLDPGAVVYSNIVQISGLTADAAVSVVPSACEFAISNNNNTSSNSDGFDVLTGVSFGTTGTITNGQYLQLKGPASSTPQATITYSVNIGGGVGISGWLLTTGVGVDDIPDNFVFTNLVQQIPGTPDLPSDIKTISGLTAGLAVPLTVRTSSPVQANPRIRVNQGSTANISNIFVENGDTVQLIMNAHPDLPIAPSIKASKVGINVGNVQITEWSITNWYGPDETPSFVVPADIFNQTPGGTGVIGPVLLTDYNVPITVSITTPVAYNASDNPTGESVNPVLVSINGAGAVPLPATIPNDPTGNPVAVTFFTDQPGNANANPVQGLSHYLKFNITFGLATPFEIEVNNYAVKPVPPAYISQWYTNKNDSFDEDAYQAAGSPVANANAYYRASKFDGLTLGTVVAVPKEDITGYGDLEARYPGFLECNGQTVNAADYPFLWDQIENNYGGNGSYNSTSKQYSGTFKLPDYRNKRLAGKGIVDASRGASAFLEATNAGGAFDIVGSTGGYWYVSDVGVAGPDPLEQVITIPGQPTGTQSEFYELGTPRTFGLTEVTAEVDFFVNGSSSGEIPGVRDVRVTVPPHEHFYVSGQTEAPSGDPLIPWETVAYYRKNDSTGGPTGEMNDEPSTDAVYSKWVSDGNVNAGEFNQQLVNTFGPGASLKDYVPLGPEGTTSNATFGNYWGSPTSALPNQNGLFRKQGTLNDAGVLDTEPATGRVETYVSPEAEATHDHLLGQDKPTDLTTDYSYGNATGSGGSIQGLATFGANTTVEFNQAEVQIELNQAEFNWSNSTKPIPSVAMDPQRKVPIVAPFHKVKYIIKAY